MAETELTTFWSRSAVEHADSSLSQIQQRVLTECADVAREAEGPFLHVVETLNGATYLCQGRMEGNVCHVWVQLAEYVPLTTLAENYPRKNFRGQTFQMPRAVDAPGNDVFTEIGNLEM